MSTPKKKVRKIKKLPSQVIINIKFFDQKSKEKTIKLLRKLRNVTKIISKNGDDESILKLLQVHNQLQSLYIKRCFPWNVKNMKNALKNRKFLDLTTFSQVLKFGSDQLRTFSYYFPNLMRVELKLVCMDKSVYLNPLYELLKNMINAESIKLFIRVMQIQMLHIIQNINGKNLQDLWLSYAKIYPEYKENEPLEKNNIIAEIGVLIEKMVKLKSLKLHIANDIKEIELLAKHLINLTNLEYLDIYKNQKFINHDIGKLINLKIFENLLFSDEDDDVLNRIDQLKNLTHLQNLKLKFKGIIDSNNNEDKNIDCTIQKKHENLLFRRNEMVKQCLMNFKEIKELNLSIDDSWNNQFKSDLFKSINEFSQLSILSCYIKSSEQYNPKVYSYFDDIWTWDILPKQLLIFKLRLDNILVTPKNIQNLCISMKKMKKIEKIDLQFDYFIFDEETLIQIHNAMKSYNYFKKLKIYYRKDIIECEPIEFNLIRKCTKTFCYRLSGQSLQFFKYI